MIPTDDIAASRGRSRPTVIAALGASQTLAWASSYYLPAILADPIAADLGVSRAVVLAAFSMSLLIAAFIGPSVGSAIDRRGVLALSNLVLAAGLAMLAAAAGPASLFGAWAVIGVGMALGLYDAGFATLTSLYGREARGPITGITLFAGFASTVSWPLTAALNDALGWRETCLVWAGLNLIIGLPLNRLLPRSTAALTRPSKDAEAAAAWKPYREMLLLAFVFAAVWFVTGAMAAHLPRLLQLAGATPVEAVATAALMGPAQVAARLAELMIMRRIHPLVSARIATALHPLGAGALLLLGPAGAPLFVVLYGAGNGLLDHCARHGAACPVWSARVRPADRAGGRAGPRRAGLGTAGIRVPARPHGDFRHSGLGRPMHRGAGRAALPACRPGGMTCSELCAW